MSFLDDLNESQRKAVEYCDGPSLVIAGAGSGKTRVLTYKIAYLLSQGMKPWNILALTFTNKAANEMKQRIGALVGNDMARSLNMGTFHSVFSRILRVEAASLGYAPNYTIYDEKDSQSLLKAIIKEEELDVKVYKPDFVSSLISLAKNSLVFPQDNENFEKLLNDYHIQDASNIGKIYSSYCERCKKANVMDFDDLLTNIFILFNEHEDIRLKYANKFKYILVDEYQDTNNVQQKIILQLLNEHKRVCAVGDDAQSIYSFRGANIDNILHFDKIFAGTRIFKLEQNYRSTQRIVKASNSLISQNENRIKKELYSLQDEGKRLILKSADDGRLEAEMVCREIMRLIRRDKYNYSDIAVFYRVSSLSTNFEQAMTKFDIPYKVYGGLGFYQRKEIKDIISYFRFVLNPDDEEAFKRIINSPKRGIGNVTLSKIVGLASVYNVSPWTIINEPEKFGLSIAKGTLEKLEDFKQLINTFIQKRELEDVDALGHEIYTQSGLEKEISSDVTSEGRLRQQHVEELFDEITNFVEDSDVENKSLKAFLNEKSLLSDVDKDAIGDNCVSLMTIHNAKGLEFPIVFVVGLEDNVFPVKRAIGNNLEIEEERRLFYVAITRAERLCYLTFAKIRTLYGDTNMETPSRFLSDIKPELLNMDENVEMLLSSSNHYLRPLNPSNRWQNSRPVASQFRADPKPRVAVHREEPPVSDTFSPGFQRLRAVASMQNRRAGSVNDGSRAAVGGLKENCVIEHERFGIGKVVRLEGSGENMKATVQFENAGVKQLLVKFARFTVVDEG